jgi:hypothetical protein
MKNRFFIAFSMFVLIALACVPIYRMRRVRTTITVQQVQDQIRQNLVIGSTRNQVEAYLEAQRIPHSYVNQSPAGPEYSRIESALIADSSSTRLVRGDIQIVFRFDDHDKLTQYTVKEIFTGP